MLRPKRTAGGETIAGSSHRSSAVAGSFLLHHELVRARGGTAARWALILHGALGSGANWRLFAARLARTLPDWGFVLVDLRGHGLSRGAPPPHTLRAAAGDLVRLEARLGLPVDAVIGHSFGGKVALAFLDARPAPLQAAFILDSAPGASQPTGGVLDVLAFLQSVPQPLPTRARFLELAMGARAAGGAELGRTTAEWLATQVRPAADGLRIRLDLPAVADLLADYFVQDLWRVLEEGRGASALHLVVGGRSNVVSPADRARLEALGSASAGRVRVHVLDEAGHWLHVDDPVGLHDILTEGLGARHGGSGDVGANSTT